jgi:hypothetical protein
MTLGSGRARRRVERVFEPHCLQANGYADENRPLIATKLVVAFGTTAESVAP